MTELNTSVLNMITEHQQLAERAIRLHDQLVGKNCTQYIPLECLIMIQEMKNIALTGNPAGNKQPEDLPFIDREIYA